jgi:hypothetical protein
MTEDADKRPEAKDISASREHPEGTSPAPSVFRHPTARWSRISPDDRLLFWITAGVALVIGVAAGLITDGISVSGPYHSLKRGLGLESETLKPKIAVALPYRSGDAKAADEIYRSVLAARDDFCAGDGEGTVACTVEITQEDDRGVPDDAARVARQLRNDENYLAVIGHLSSSTTAQALTEYCQGPNPVPIIMPVVTATSILQKARALGCPATLRLAPTNEAQGYEAAALLARIQSAPNAGTLADQMIGVMRDQSNPVYSNDYGRALFDALRKAAHTPRDGIPHYKVLFNVAVGGEAAGLPITSGMQRLTGC